MMKTTEIIKNLLYIPLDIPNPPVGCIDGIENIPKSMMKWDEFRNCYLIPIAIDYREEKQIEWFEPFCERFPALVKWLKDDVIPVTGFGRTLIIVTAPGETNSPHIDAAPETFDDLLNQKFRYVVNGNVSDLEFLTDTDETIRLPEIDKPFMMNGKWPHKMTNTNSGTKYTVAIGWPWEPSADDEKYQELISRSYEKFSSDYLSNEHISLPDNWETMFEDYDANKATHNDAKEHAEIVEGLTS